MEGLAKEAGGLRIASSSLWAFTGRSGVMYSRKLQFYVGSTLDGEDVYGYGRIPSKVF